MAFLPQLAEVSQKKDMVSAFGGLSRNLYVKPGEWRDTKNLTSDDLPMAAVRKKRRLLRTLATPNGLFGHDELCWVDGTDFYYGGTVKGEVASGEKQFCRMGARVLIWPDKVSYNSETDVFERLDNTVTTEGTVTASLCKRDGAALTVTASETAPENPASGDYWLDTGENLLKLYGSGEWQTSPTVYTKIACTGLGVGFSEGDVANISGMETESLNGDFALEDATEDALVVIALITETATQAAAVTAQRKIPDMDFICESDNRIWGCSSENHEIYASKLGDAKNWNSFQGLSTDSYALTVGSGGGFTGCRAHLGYVLFFKEGCIHKIYGSKPSNYQLTTLNCRGVGRGMEKSMACVNEVLYYKSPTDVCAYQSAMPTGISEKLGTDAWTGAVGGAYQAKYYLCLKTAAASALYVCDTRNGVWLKEDALDVKAMASCGGELYLLLADGRLLCVGGTATYDGEGAEAEADVDWLAETGDLGLDTPLQKHVSKLQVVCTIGSGSTLTVEMQYDGGAWETAHNQQAADRQTVTVNIVPRRCQSMRMRLSGTGSAVLYSLTRTVETGSEVRYV